MSKQIIITKLFDSGGSNAHFKTLLRYWNNENVILILENQEQSDHLRKIITGEVFKVMIIPNLHGYASLRYLPLTNIKEGLVIIRSLITLLFLSVRHGFAGITISAVEPEKHLYTFWLPFVRVIYILHSEPRTVLTRFTTRTCNLRLNNKKRIITVSKSMQSAIIGQWEINRCKTKFINVIYNCVMEPDFQKSEDNRRNVGNKLTIITLGHVDERKNPRIWVEVAEKVTSEDSRAEFLWLGNGPLLDIFKERTKENPRIKFLGLTDNPQRYLEMSAIYYQPSLIEPHGIAVLEAMYNGLPCVVSNIGGLAESVQNKINGLLVDPDDLKQNVEAILDLLKDERQRRDYGVESTVRYRDLFTYDRFKEKMDVVYSC